jgi:peptidylprolyl isomerase
MKLVKVFAILTVVGTAAAFSLSMSSASSSAATTPTPDVMINRRSFVRSASAGVMVGGLGVVQNAPLAKAADDEGSSDFVTTESGLRYKVLKEGTGAVPLLGQTVKAHYTGWLDGFDSDKKFDSSRDRGRPFTFAVGKGQVIRGWDEAFSEMKVGERRELILPPRLAYGDRGAGGIIPGGATLYFDVELLGIL